MAGGEEILDLDAALARIGELEQRLEKTLTSPDNLLQNAILEQSPVAISVRDRNGNLILCNKKWAKIWETNEQDVDWALSRKREEFQLDNKDLYLGKNQMAVAQVYKNGGNLELEEIYVEAISKWVKQRFYGITGESGSIQYVVILTEDVTERVSSRRIEDELRESREEYAALVKNLPVAAYTTDEHGYTISANPAMVKMFGAESLDDLLLVPVEKRYRNPSDRQLFLSELKKNGKLTNYEVELVRKGVIPFWASISATVTLHENGEISKIDGIISDISATKALEKEMLKAQKLESIGILAGGIAHDFNNILAAVLGNISLAKLYASQDRRVCEKLDNAEKASIRASELTRQLLTFSRGGQPVRKIADFQNVLKEAISFAATGSNILVSYSLAKDLWPVEIDEAQIGQAVNNLVMNAIQAMPDGGKLSITGENAIIQRNTGLSLDPGNYLKITLADNGIGIPGELQSKIFDPYFTTKPGGTGLGLAAVYSILRNHGGCVTVESEAELGSKFSIFLPAVKDSFALSRYQPSPEIALPGHGRILVMDDESAVLEVIVEMLNQHGYCSDTASCGSQAAEMYSEALKLGKKYDLVIVDFTVPGGDGGLEALTRIRAFDPSAKVIVASGYAGNTVMSHCRDYGFTDAIAKPFRLRTLLEAVHNAVNSNKSD
jgi:two-component system cell cycle sensor histidine kinase/response regulator CckA